MRILYDYQILTQKYGGISRYIYYLADYMKKNGNDVDVRTLFSNNVYFEQYFQNKKPTTESLKWLKGKTSLNKLYCLAKPKNSYNIIHPTYYDPYIIGKYKGKLVVTVHDMIHEKLMKDNINLINQKKEYIYKSDKIIAVSEYTKKDILEIYRDIDEKKIEVIYQGADFSNETDNDIIGEQYVLYVGDRKAKYKNFENFLKASNIFLKKNSCLKVICAGGREFNENEKNLISSLGLDNRFVQYNFQEDELYGLYHYARCFVFPSVYEGFGIPLIEGMKADCPVICSKSSCFPEIAGNAAEYFDGNNVDDIAEKIDYVINNDKRRQELIEAGKEKANYFTWERTGKNTLDLYKKMCSE